MCDFVGVAPYAFFFAGIGFATATIGILFLSRSSRLLGLFLTNGLASSASQDDQQASQPASLRPDSKPTGFPVRNGDVTEW